MALYLLDLGHEVDYIDIDPARVPYSFDIKLGSATYRLTIKYNEIGGFYTADLATLMGEVLAYGDPIRYGRPLFGSVEDERFPRPVIIPACLSGEDITEVTEDNLGAAVRLYLYERKEDE